MQKRSIVFISAIPLILALNTVATAADSIIGTWKLNVAKSSLPPSLSIESSVCKAEALDGGIKITYDSVITNGKSHHEQFAAKYDGKDYPNTRDSLVIGSVVVKRIDTNNLQFVQKKDGKEVFNEQINISKDGKVQTDTMKGKDAQGRDFTLIWVYDKVILGDPQLGTWVLDVNKSTFKFGPVPRSEIRVFTMAGENLKFTSDGVDAGGRAWHNEYTAKLDGKDYPISGPQDLDSISLKRVNPFILEVMMKKAGKVVITGTRVISKDGKTATVTNTRTDAKGGKVSNVQIFVKR
jgi:hypothetical protein